MSRRTLGVFALLISGCSFAQAAEPLVNAAPRDCPPPVTVVPRFPTSAAAAGVSGVVKVLVRIDACGRVLDAKLAPSNATWDMKQAALKAMRESVLPESERARAVDGVVEQEVGFTLHAEVRRADIKSFAWPSSHGNPVYVLDDSLREAGSAEVVSAGIVDSDPNALRAPVVAAPHRFMEAKGSQGKEFWLKVPEPGGSRIVIAARYRPVMEDGAPVVHLAIVCDMDADQCASITRTLLKGLPFAKTKQVP